jgi:hypothetical protein
MSATATVGIDLAKSVFSIHAVNEQRKTPEYCGCYCPREIDSPPFQRKAFQETNTSNLELPSMRIMRSRSDRRSENLNKVLGHYWPISV